MPLIARKDGSGDVVNTIHVSCIVPVDISTLSGSSDVFIVGHGCHREDDTNEPHDHCPPVSSTTVNSFSPDVYVNGKKVVSIPYSRTDPGNCPHKVKLCNMQTCPPKK